MERGQLHPPRLDATAALRQVALVLQTSVLCSYITLPTCKVTLLMLR